MIPTSQATNSKANNMNWTVHSNTSNMNLETICKEIEKGDKNEGGIRLKPFYQRDYKFTRKDESLLIESLLIGIPIPTIYLASDISKVPHTSNVIDGHHRLRAIYRFKNNEFALIGLNRLDDFNGKYFRDLDAEIANKLLYQISLNLQLIHVQNNPDLEVEIFTRYNKGTHPLTPQEIRHVIYNSKFNDWLLKLVDNLKKQDVLKEVYNITPKRYTDKIVHENLCVLFSILHDDLDEKCVSSPQYTEKIMKFSHELKPDEIDRFIYKCEVFITVLNTFLEEAYIKNNITNPFSKMVFEEKAHHKFQTSIMMCMVSCLRYTLQVCGGQLELQNDNLMQGLRHAIKSGFINSGFNKVTSSTTKPSLLKETSDEIKKEIDDLLARI